MAVPHVNLGAGWNAPPSFLRMEARKTRAAEFFPSGWISLSSHLSPSFSSLTSSPRSFRPVSSGDVTLHCITHLVSVWWSSGTPSMHHSFGFGPRGSFLVILHVYSLHLGKLQEHISIVFILLEQLLDYGRTRWPVGGCLVHTLTQSQLFSSMDKESSHLKWR